MHDLPALASFLRSIPFASSCRTMSMRAILPLYKDLAMQLYSAAWRSTPLPPKLSPAAPSWLGTALRSWAVWDRDVYISWQVFWRRVHRHPRWVNTCSGADADSHHDKDQNIRTYVCTYECTFAQVHSQRPFETQWQSLPFLLALDEECTSSPCLSLSVPLSAISLTQMLALHFSHPQQSPQLPPGPVQWEGSAPLHLPPGHCLQAAWIEEEETRDDHL